MKELLLDLSQDEIIKTAESIGTEKYRGKQLFKWLTLGEDYPHMSNLPKPVRARLEEKYDCVGAFVKETFLSSDGTVKFLLLLRDGSLIESVLMHNNYGNTLCVSTQVGCRMGCKFCASGLDGLFRNLTPGEMLSEVILANRYLKSQSPNFRVGNVVLMGSGEPLDNYDNVTKFIRLLNEYCEIGQRSVSLSTCGLVNNIKRLADDGFSVTLCISLHSPFDEKRETVMPVAKSFKIKEIMDAARYYFEKSGRRVIIEYAMMKGFNTSLRDVDELKTITKGMAAHVNLIPLNNTGSGLNSVTKKEAYAFLQLFETAGLSATIRRSLGGDISGACGQLKRKYLDENEKK